MEADEKAIWIARRLLGFIALRELLGKLFKGTNLQLPSGDFEVPLVIQNKAFDAQGRLLFDTFDHDGFLGNQFVVNGTIQPFFEVKRQK